MDPEVLRQTILKDIDGILQSPWIIQKFISPDDKRLLQAQREYWRTAEVSQLGTLLALYNQEP